MKQKQMPSPMRRGPGRRRPRVLFAVLACAVVAAVGIWGISEASAVKTSASQQSSMGSSRRATTTIPPATSTSTAAVPTLKATQSAKSEAPATVAAPAAPIAGKSDKELAATAPQMAAPVAFGAVSTIKTGITAMVSAMTPVKGEAQGIGEISGPAVQFVVTVRNSSGEALALTNAIVNVDAGPDHSPAMQLSGPGVTKFPASIAPGDSGSATYVFLIPQDQRVQIRVFLTYAASAPIAVFEGTAPKAEG